MRGNKIFDNNKMYGFGQNREINNTKNIKVEKEDRVKGDTTVKKNHIIKSIIKYLKKYNNCADCN